MKINHSFSVEKNVRKHSTVGSINVSVTVIKVNVFLAKRKKWQHAIVERMMILLVVQNKAMDVSNTVENYLIVIIINVKKIVIKVNVALAKKHQKSKKHVIVEDITS